MGDKAKGVIGKVILMGEAVILKNSDSYLVPLAVEISRLWAMSEAIDYRKVTLKPNRSTEGWGGRHELQQHRRTTEYQENSRF